MSDNKNNLKNRFDNFEPEVDESRIEKNWQKIKDKLPQEESKRKGFFLLSLLLVGLFALGYLFCLLYNDSKTGASGNNSILSKSNNNIKSDSSESKSTSNLNNTQQLNQGDSTRNSTESHQHSNYSSISTLENKNNASLNQPSSSKPKQIESNKSLLKESKKQTFSGVAKNADIKSFADDSKDIKRQNTFANGKDIKSVNLDLFKSKNNNSVDGNITQQNNKEDLLTETELSKIDFIIDYMKVITDYNLSRDTANKCVQNAILKSVGNETPTVNNSKLENRFGLDVFFGVNHAQTKTSVILNSSDSTFKTSNIGFSIGTALNYKFNKKLVVTGQIIINDNKLRFEKENETRIDIGIIKNSVFDTLASSYQIDTSYKYFNYNHHYSLKSYVSFNFALGLTYLFINKGKYFLDASLLFNVKQSKYNLEKISHLNADTVFYTSNSFYQATDSQAYSYNNNNPSANAPELHYEFKNQSIINYGVMPSLTFGYNVNKRLSIIIKPSYYINLTKNDINLDDLIYKINQNNLFIHFGIKRRF